VLVCALRGWPARSQATVKDAPPGHAQLPFLQAMRLPSTFGPMTRGFVLAFGGASVTGAETAATLEPSE